MREHMWGVIVLVVLAGGCAVSPPPGSSGQVKGPLTSIELYTKRPVRGEYYSTAGRQRLFASDREFYVLSRWNLPNPGEYVSQVAVTPPNLGAKQQSEHQFRAEGTNWVTFQRFSLPSGEDAKSLAGEWQVEVALNGALAGTRTFQFDAASIRLRTEAKLYIAEGKADHETAPGDYVWRNQYAVREQVKGAALVAGQVLRDDLSRRFPDVTGPAPMQEASGDSIILTPVLRLSPNPGIPSRMELEILQPGTGQRRVFEFRSTAGNEFSGGSGRVYFSVASADLAFQAGSSREILDFLVQATKATPET